MPVCMYACMHAYIERGLQGNFRQGPNPGLRNNVTGFRLEVLDLERRFR